MKVQGILREIGKDVIFPVENWENDRYVREDFDIGESWGQDLWRYPPQN